SKDLLQRAASVTLKEGRPLVVAVRETPLGGPTLRQLVALDDAGATVLPASPAFYAGATHIQDLVDFVAGRVLDAVDVEHRLYRRWEDELGGGSRTHGPRPAPPGGRRPPAAPPPTPSQEPPQLLDLIGRLRSHGRGG